MNTIDAEKATTPQPSAQQPTGKRTAAKKANPAKKASRAKKAVGKPAAERNNKKAEVITLMKCTKEATVPVENSVQNEMRLDREKVRAQTPQRFARSEGKQIYVAISCNW